MNQVRYSRHEGPGEEPDLQDLLDYLQDLLLDSGFSDPWDPQPDSGQAYEDLLAAIAAALEQGGMIPEGWTEEAEAAADWLQTRLGQLVQKLAERLVEAGLVVIVPGEGGGSGPGSGSRFELTARAADLLGQRSLKQILGVASGNSAGFHRTRQVSQGTDSPGGSRRWQPGEALHLDASETLRSAARHGLQAGRLDIAEEDLHVQEGEQQTAAATVLLLDCSHSMILYGEDRFTPAKRVALALSHLIRNQYPGDTLRVVLFHDSAEEVRLGRLATSQVGPWHTNTAGGLRLALKLLNRHQQDYRQIIMITDGKPTAITLPGGRIYKNAYGQDPLVMKETLHQVGECRRRGVVINTFMLARDPALLAFVERVTRMTGGRAYLTSPSDVGSYVLRDFSRHRRG